jgi:anaerobic magnesium-protoporphyrin IX monomethyl ester cyclase
MSQVKILLINPPFFLEERYGKKLKHFGALSEPLGLAYLAANLESHNYPVKILDCPALGIHPEDIVKELIKDTYGLIGLTMLTPMFAKVKQTAEIIKKTCPKAKIIVGGAHPTALPKRTLEEIQELDYICVGEGEKTIVELAQALEGKRHLDQIAGLAFRENGQIVLNPPRELEKNLDNFPSPARHLLPIKKYKLTATRTQKNSFCPTIIVARGCPFNCSYCSHPFGRTFRHHSVERVIQEIESLIKEYHISEFNMEADNLTVDKNFLTLLCQEIIKKKFNQNVRWTCESRMDTVDKELLKIMHQAGCWQISYGVESGVQRLLDLINKGETLEDMEKTFAITKEIGITIRGFFMLGLPTETYQESLQTIEFAKSLDPFWAQFTITTPYPGTSMFETLKAKGEIKTFNWEHYNTWTGWKESEMVYLFKNRTLKELKSLQKKAVMSFYLRPKVFFRFIKSVNSWATFKKYLQGFLILLKVKLEKSHQI